MKLKMKVKRGKTKDLEKTLKHLRSLSQLTIDAGYFGDQGEHSKAEVPYAQLMAWHEIGAGNYPSRPVLQTTANIIEASAKNKGFNNYVTDLVGQVGRLKPNSDRIGKRVQEVGQSVFGDSGFLDSNSERTIAEKGFNAPLIGGGPDGGELMDNFAYRTSIDGETKT